MSSNFLKLNDDKPEVIIFGSAEQLKKIELCAIRIGDSLITVSHDNGVASNWESDKLFRAHAMRNIEETPVNLQGVAVPADHISLPVDVGQVGISSNPYGGTGCVVV